MQSFTEPNAFIITQYPLKDTEVDLWRLCMDHEVHALVVLEENKQVLQMFETLNKYNRFYSQTIDYIQMIVQKLSNHLEWMNNEKSNILAG